VGEALILAKTYSSSGRTVGEQWEKPIGSAIESSRANFRNMLPLILAKTYQ
jgi:hypothetical protein